MQFARNISFEIPETCYYSFYLLNIRDVANDQFSTAYIQLQRSTFMTVIYSQRYDHRINRVQMTSTYTVCI